MKYTKKDLLKSHGAKCTVTINGHHCEGKIAVERNNIYICQDKQEGIDCSNKLGYKYSYIITDSEGNLREHWYSNLVLIDEFVLPEKWMVKITPENAEILEKWRLKQPGSNPSTRCKDYMSGHLLSTTNWDYSYIYSSTPPEDHGFELITFEQFKSHVLKEKDMKQEQVGWILKPEFESLESTIETICHGSSRKISYCGEQVNFSTGSISEGKFKGTGVLELWFNPVYKSEKKIPTILKYELKKEHADSAGFGCVRFNTNRLKDAVSNLTKTIYAGDVKISGIYLSNGEKVSIELLQEIVDYTNS